MNTPRRSLSEGLTRKQRAFLTAPEAESSREEPVHIATVPTETEARVVPVSRIGKIAQRAPKTTRPRPLRSITLRLHAPLIETLRRESIQRSLDYVEPFTQQAIVEDALRSWLRGRGCLLDD